MEVEEKQYTVAQVSSLLQVNPETVRRWIRIGKLQARLADNKAKKEFYKTMIQRRIERILEPAYEKAYKQTKSASHTKPYKKKSKGFEYGE